jgi:putative transposase
VWSYDFVFDYCANGQQLKCLTVTDEFTKEGLAIDVDGRIRSARVIEVLSGLVSARGAPSFLRGDNGPEFVSSALLSWIVSQGIGTALIEPGKLWQEWRHGELQRQVPRRVSEPRMVSFTHRGQGVIEARRRHFNEVSAFEPRLPHVHGRKAIAPLICG